MHIQPYVFYDGRCEEALEFYKKALGAQVGMMMRFSENPEKGASAGGAPGSEEKIMHAEFKIGESTILCSDGMAKGQPKFDGFSLTIIVPDVATADKLFAALSGEGQVQMPLTKTFFSEKFGMVADKFGVSWMIYVGK